MQTHGDGQNNLEWTVGHRRNKKRKQEIKMIAHNISKYTEYNKSSVKRKVFSNQCLHQEIGNTSNKWSINTSQGLKTNHKPNPK